MTQDELQHPKDLDPFDLTGRVAIITGACGLLGRQHCEALSAAGASVVAVDLANTDPEGWATELQSRWRNGSLGYILDITDQDAVTRMTQFVRESLGRIDILVNNASFTVKGGSALGQDFFSPIETYPMDLWRLAIDTTLTGTFICCQAAGRHMSEQGGGVIVNVSSIYGMVGPDPRIYENASGGWDPSIHFNTPASYAAAKAGILGLTRYLATVWAHRNIRVNALTPGGVYDDQDERFVQAYSSRVPMGRMASKTEYRGAVVFLASDASAYMTGTNLVVDGGWTAW